MKLLFHLCVVLCVILLFACTEHQDQKFMSISDASITDTQWGLIKIHGENVTENNSIHLTLGTEESKAHGNSGCNQFSGDYELSGSNLSFAQMISTRKACETGMELEHDFLTTLSKVSTYSISDNQLSLQDDSNQEILVFQQF